jgi:glycosyltransferase involved in cell wall biosynthesis
MPPLVSVIVPAYNYARYLGDALDSVRAQTYREWECIVVDDGSTDDTAAVAQRYAGLDPRVRCVRQENAGLAAARNAGLHLSRGELIQFLDADDLLAPHKLQLHADFLAAHPDTDIVYSEVGFFRSDAPRDWRPSLGGRLSRSIMARVHGADDARRKLQHYNIMPVLAALVRRGVFDTAGAFDRGAPAYEDYGFWIRCAAAGCRFDFCDAAAPVAGVRAHEASMSRDPRRMLDGLVSIANAFAASPQRVQWHGDMLPLIYEVALGVDAVRHGARVRGMRRIWRAARAATERLTALRWRVYALAALVLPRGAFVSFVAAPIPERPFELYRRFRAMWTR